MAFDLPSTSDYGKENPEDWTIYEDLMSKCPMKEPATSLIKWKGISDSLIDKMKIGFLDNVAIAFTDLSMKYGANRLKESGLVFRKGRHEGKYLFTYHKILFPFIEENRIKSIIGMKVEKSQSWNFQSVLKDLSYIYNSDLLNTINSGDTLHVTESILDCLGLIEKSDNAVGIFGLNSFKDEYYDLLNPYSIVLHKNSGNPNSNYSRELASMMSGRGIKVTRADMPTGF